MFTALQATSLSLANLLGMRFMNDVRLRSFFNPVFGGTMIVSLNSPQEMTNLGTQGLSSWLYQVVRDNERLNILPEKIGPNQYRREPLPVRLHYLMTPLVSVQSASSAETEQMIMDAVFRQQCACSSLRSPHNIPAIPSREKMRPGCTNKKVSRD